MIFDSAEIGAISRMQRQRAIEVFEIVSNDGSKTRIVMATTAAAPTTAPAALDTSGNAPGASPPASEAAETIRSEWFGRFRRSHPDRPADHVQVGEKVAKGQTVALLELQGFYTEVTAQSDGAITAILVNEGDLIDYGKPLFAFERSPETSGPQP